MSKINKILEERGKNYGDFSEVCNLLFNLNECIRSHHNYLNLSNEHKIVFEMIFLKIARCICGDSNYSDNIRDIIGYATLLLNNLERK